MKKILLLMTLFLALGFSAKAAEYTFKMADIYGSAKIDPLQSSSTWGDFEITVSKNSGSSNPAYVPNGDVRVYAKGSITISSSSANITDIVFYISDQGKKRLAPITASTGSIATQASGDETVTWTGDANEIKFTVGDKANYGADGATKAGQFCFLSVTITTSDAAVAVLAPVFSTGSGNVMAGTEVELTCDTEGADIYYTEDGTDPTAQSTKYDGPITIDETVTIKAIAIKGADKSAIATATYTIIESVNTLATAKTYGKGGAFFYTGDLTIVYKNGLNVYVYDGTEYALIYGTVNGDAGQVIKGGWEATVDIYSGLFELKPAGNPTVEGTAAIPAPTDITTANMADFFVAANVSAYCVMKDVTIDAATPDATVANFNVKVGDTSVTFRNNFKLASVEPGKYDVTGFIGIFNTTMQFYPTAYTVKQEFETVEAPVFNPAAGAVALGTEVEITCATQGATIYYTTNGVDPTEESEAYTGPITIDEDVTIKAIAIKNEVRSEIVVAAYTIIGEDEGEKAEFVMENIYANSTFEAVDKWGDFTIATNKNGGSNAPTYNKTGKDVRIYAKGTLTITATNASIVKIVFDLSSQGVTRQAELTPTTGNVEQTTGSSIVTWTGEANEITFTVGEKAVYSADTSKAGQFDFSKVTIYYKDDNTSGIKAIEVGNGAPAQYYNLNGMRIENPAAGQVVIRVQDGKAAKIRF